MGEPEPDDAVLFVGVSLVLGIASRHLLRGTRVPYTVALLVLGVALGSLGKRWNFLPSTSCTAMDEIPPFSFPTCKISYYSIQPLIAPQFSLFTCSTVSYCYPRLPEYGTQHGLGKLGAGIRICKFLVLRFILILQLIHST